jgi:hypothetical protein
MNKILVTGAATCLLVLFAPAWARAQITTTTSPTTTTPTTTPTLGGNTQNQLGSLLNQQNSTNQVTTSAMLSMTSGAGSATTWPSNANPFVQTYIDPLSVGLPSKFATQVGIAKPTGTFNKPLFTATTSTGTGAGTPTTTTQKMGFTTYGTPRAPLYATVLSDDVPLVQFRSEDIFNSVRGVIERSTYVPSKANIQVTVQGTTVQLQGQVASDKERRLVEGMVRTTPGVRDVVNQLTVAGLPK